MYSGWVHVNQCDHLTAFLFYCKVSTFLIKKAVNEITKARKVNEIRQAGKLNEIRQAGKVNKTGRETEGNYSTRVAFVWPVKNIVNQLTLLTVCKYTKKNLSPFRWSSGYSNWICCSKLFQHSVIFFQTLCAYTLD